MASGSRSWRFAESAGHMSHLALFVRDAAGLDVPPDLVVPPALSGDVPDRRAVLDDGQRRAAGRQWTGWWWAVVCAEIRRNTDPGAADRGIGGRPDVVALADRPELQHAVRALDEEGARWVGRDERSPHEGRFPWALVRDVAEDVAFDRHVGLGAVQGSVEVLAVTGVWWTRAAPGAVLCSIDAAADPITAHAVLRDAFESGLRR